MSRHASSKEQIMNAQDAGQVSDAFQVFLSQASKHAQAWMTAVQGLDEASALDKKTEELAYLAVLAAVGLESGIPFHVQMAKAAGATRDEVIGAVLIGLPAAGQVVIRSLPAALRAFDGNGKI
jgi:4-carboxymuconolactone decarboxylase